MSKIRPYVSPRLQNSVVSSTVFKVTSVSVEDLHTDILATSCEISQEEVDKESARDRLFLIITIVFGSASIVTGLIAMWVQYTYLCIFTFSWPLVTVPTAITQRTQINRMNTYQHVHNEIRNEANGVMKESEILKKTIKKLEKVVKRQATVEAELDVIVRREGGNMDAFLLSVKENQRTIDKIKAMSESIQRQGILTSILRTDCDEDFEMSADEFKVVLHRLTAEDVDVDRFKKKLGSSRTVSDVFTAASRSMKNQESGKAWMELV